MSNVIRYSEAPANPAQLASKGAAQFLDLEHGYVYDGAGNQIAKWDPIQHDDRGALADFCADYALSLSASSMSHADPDRAQAMLMSGLQLYGAEDSAVLMDLGPTDVHIPAAMPNFASGYRNFAPLADAILPPLLVDKQVNNYFQFDKNDAFQRALPNAGGGGTMPAEITPRLSNSQYSCIERALGGYVPAQVEANADAPLRIRQATSTRIMNALILEREIRAQALLRTSGNWNSTQVVTIAAGSQWNGGAASDPVKDLHGLLEASYGDVTGILMPEKVFHAFQRNPAVRGYYAGRSSTPSMPDATQIASILGLPPIYVAKTKFINSSGALDYVWGSDVVLFRQPAEMPPTSQDDVATGYTFRWKLSNAKDGVISGGMTVREFYVQDRGSLGGNKIVIVHSDAEQITSKFIGGLIVSAYQ